MIAKLIGFSEDEVKVTWPGSKVVQICSTMEEFPLISHKLAGNGLWINRAKSPSELAAASELKNIAAWWLEQPESAGTVQTSSTTVTDRDGNMVASLSAKRDKVVWGITEFKVRWLAR